MTAAHFSENGGGAAARTAGMLNQAFDRLSAPEIEVAHRSFLSFKLCGCTGLVLGTLLGATLIGHAVLSLAVLAEIVVAAIVTFFAVLVVTKIITGEERIIYYHHEIAVMIIAALFLWITHQPILPYLDITILGIGTFLTFGRIGCLLVGCCHGRPYHWGVRYGQEHAEAGFPSYLVGVRLFPIQAVESLWVACTVVVGTYFVWTGRPAGTALAWYVITYDLGRFAFEFARGDADRSYWFGFSQPQWLSLLLTGGVGWAELAGLLPLSRWHVASFVLLLAIMIGVSLRRHFGGASNFELLHPRHIRQIASAMRMLNDSDRTGNAGATARVIVPVACTSLGVRISTGKIDHEKERIYHYTISRGSPPMSERGAKALAKTIRYLNRQEGSDKLIAGDQGIYHLLIRRPLGANS